MKHLTATHGTSTNLKDDNTSELRPTVTVPMQDLLNCLVIKGIIPPGSKVTDCWTSTYDTSVTFEYGDDL